MKFPFRLLPCALVLFAAGCATRPETQHHTAAHSRPTPLLLISIDAFRADYFDRGQTPTLAMLAHDGVHATSMQPSFPSLTFPNHYTIITGLRPDHHGIVHNDMVDPVLGTFAMSNHAAVRDGRWWDEGTPLWVSADQQGLRTATMFWPGSEADIHGVLPDYSRAYDGKVTADQRVDQVLAWLDLPADKRPDFLTLYFDRVDHAGHDFGPDSPEVNEALRNTDAAIKRLVEGLRKRGLFNRMNIIVLADHGMATVPAGHTVVLDALIPMDHVQAVTMGVLAGINPKPGYAFAPIEATLEQPHAHMQCWDKTRVPKRLAYGHNPRVPKLLCLADLGWTVSTQHYLDKKKKMKLGEHGYDNALPQMQALFLAHGPAFRRGYVQKTFPNVDVYPLMTHLLGITPAANDGHYADVKGMLTPAAQ